MKNRIAMLIAVGLFAAACSPSDQVSGTIEGTTEGTAINDVAVTQAAADINQPAVTDFDVVAYGDASDCREPAGDVAKLVGNIKGDVLIAGDLAYPTGSQANFDECFTPLYSDIIERLRAVPGDNDYRTDGALPFFETLGPERAGNPGEGWWSFTKEGWQVIGINSECSEIDFCGPESPQYEFVAAALAAEPDKCRMAIWHKPRFTSSANYDGLGNMSDLYQLLYDNGTDILVVGNSHHYERFEPLDPSGDPNPKGIANFTVGTGGAPYTEFGEPLPGSVVRNNDTRGVVKFTLAPTEYSWKFLSVGAGDLEDSGTTSCHNG